MLFFALQTFRTEPLDSDVDAAEGESMQAIDSPAEQGAGPAVEAVEPPLQPSSAAAPAGGGGSSSRRVLSSLDKPPPTGGWAFEAQAAEVARVLDALLQMKSPQKDPVPLGSIVSALKRAVAFARDRAGPWHGGPTAARLAVERLGLLALIDGPTVMAYADHMLRIRSCSVITAVENLGLIKDVRSPMFFVVLRVKCELRNAAMPLLRKRRAETSVSVVNVRAQVIEIMRNRFFPKGTAVHEKISALVSDINILMSRINAAATAGPERGIKPRVADLVVRTTYQPSAASCHNAGRNRKSKEAMVALSLFCRDVVSVLHLLSRRPRARSWS